MAAQSMDALYEHMKVLDQPDHSTTAEEEEEDDDDDRLLPDDDDDSAVLRRAPRHRTAIAAGIASAKVGNGSRPKLTEAVYHAPPTQTTASSLNKATIATKKSSPPPTTTKPKWSCASITSDYDSNKDVFDSGSWSSVSRGSSTNSNVCYNKFFCYCKVDVYS